MKALDRFIQNRRVAQVRPYLPQGSRVLDIGCADGVLFRRVPGLGDYVGLDCALMEPVARPRFRLIRGTFPDALPNPEPFDAITLLAVIEHIPADELERLARACTAHLKPGGHLLITVPSALVDRILAVLRCLRLIDGIALEEHHGFSPAQTPALFAGPDLKLVKHRRFQLGLNNLFVFRRSVSP
jgi:SAM-dependent methyltransferase